MLCAVALAAVSLACADLSQARLASRILHDHRARAKARPLAAAQVIHIRLTPTSGRTFGDETIEWDDANYRETVSSAGYTTVAGIQAGKGYFRDEDGVTRVASEPLLSELTSHFYFWRRGYLFDDQQGARLALGPATAASVSVRITPRGGDPLLLTFRRPDLSLVRATSRRLDLAFSSPTRFQDASRGEPVINGDIRWIGLPTGELADTAVGGWSARWHNESAETSFQRESGALAIAAKISGRSVRLAIDAADDGPLQITPALAQRLGLSFARDVFGRDLARGASLEIGDLSFPSLVVQRDDSPNAAGSDASVGAVLFRETVFEIDPTKGLLRFHDPARWVTPAGFYRVLLDDDGDRPVAILRRKGESLRLLAPSALAAPIALTEEARQRVGVSASTEVSDLHWGVVLPPIPAGSSSAQDGEFGEDGRMGWNLILRFHVFFDMPHRWAYVRALE